MATAFDMIGGLPIFRMIVIGDDSLRIADIAHIAACCSGLRAWCRDILATSRVGILMLARATTDQLGRKETRYRQTRLGDGRSCGANIRLVKQPRPTDNAVAAVLEHVALNSNGDDNCAFYVQREAASLVFVDYNHWFNRAAQRERLPRTIDGAVDHDLLELTAICLAARQRRMNYTDSDYRALAENNQYATDAELARKCKRYNDSGMCPCCAKLGECVHDDDTEFDNDELLSFRTTRRGERRRLWDAHFGELLINFSMAELALLVDRLSVTWLTQTVGSGAITNVTQINGVAFRIQQRGFGGGAAAKRANDTTLPGREEQGKRGKR